MRIIEVESTEKFFGPADAPVQLVRVSYTDADTPTRVRVDVWPGRPPSSPDGASLRCR